MIVDQHGNPAASGKRNFEAAKATRYTADWLASSGPADKIGKQDIASLRDRARDSERNDGYVEGILTELESNIVGEHGIGVKSMCRKADARNKSGIANKLDDSACLKIDQAYEEFSKRGKFDVTRQYSRAMLARATVRAVARDGGALSRLVDGIEKNEFGFMVQALEIDALNPRTNDPARRIHMGIQYDEWDEPVAYHLDKLDPRGAIYARHETFSVPAENLCHLFLSKRVSQSQGFSWLAPVLLRLRHLGKYEESEVIAARVSSNKLGFFETTGDSEYTGADDGRGNILAPSSPGAFETLPVGVTAKMIDPAHPNADYPDFRKAILRGVSAGIYLNYNTLAKDLEGVSYSSIRQGTLSERDTWRMLCKWFIECHEMPIRSRWLRMALLMGQIEGYSIADYERLNHAEFSGRTWDWVDPLNDIKTAVAEVQLGITSRQDICRKKGKSFEKIVAQNEVDIALLESAGLPSDPTGAPKPAPPVTVTESE